MKKGKVIEDLIASLEEIGYQVSRPVWKLNAEQYGVPQMRRRVFLVASRKASIIDSPPVICNPCLGRRKTSNQLKVNPEMSNPVNIGEAFLGLSYSSRSTKNRPDYSKWVAGEISLQDYIGSFLKVPQVKGSEQLSLSY